MRQRRGAARIGARIALLALVATFSTLIAPGVASAQFLDAAPSGNEYCASEGPTGDPRYRLTEAQAWSDLSLAVVGIGHVEARMYAMPSDQDCIRVKGAPSTAGVETCPPYCNLEVQTVCELHCGVHKHSAPFPWSVRLTARQTVADYVFVGWRAPCTPRRDVARSECVVNMDVDRAATAVFKPIANADKTAPAPTPALTVAPLGSYNLELRWTSSTDDWLGGYDILLNGALRSRVGTGVTTTRLIVSCNTSYSVQVVAFDYSENEAKSDVASARTGACPSSSSGSTQPRPNTAIHVKPRLRTRSRTAFFHFGYKGEVRATKYQCKLDRGRWVRCNGRTGKRYRSLRKGYHTFYVRAGNAGGFDRTPAKWRWRIV